MTQIALIPPISRASDIHLTGMQLVLPDVWNKSEEYRDELNKAHNDGSFVILDNGVFENQSSTPAIDLERIADECGAHEIVLPDMLHAPNITLLWAKEYKQYHTRGRKYMLVLQGNNWKEIKGMLDWAVDEPWISTVGLPRWMGDKTYKRDLSSMSRIIYAAQIAQNYRERFQLHFLGMSPFSRRECLQVETMKYVRSLDTSIPYVYGCVNEDYWDSKYILKRPPNYFELPFESVDNNYTRNNIKVLLTRYT